jgi:DNA-binding PadR family transcriptional regulator
MTNSLPPYVLSFLNVNASKNLEFILLSQIEQRPMTGYDLTKATYYWTASHQQIYRALNWMEQGGYIVSEHIPQEGKPDKKVYTLTKKGERTLEGIRNADVEIRTPELNTRHDSVAWLHLRNPAYFDKELESLMASLKKWKEALAELEAKIERGDDVLLAKSSRLTLIRRIEMLELEMKHCEIFKEALLEDVAA